MCQEQKIVQNQFNEFVRARRSLLVASDVFFNGTENSANTWEIITSGGGVERQNII
jgi:hypothetical protein